jgi:hypothetical protein
MNKNRKLINICGTARSGSTMVDLMLGNDLRAFSLGEVHAWFRPFRTHHFKIVCSCGENNCPWDKLKDLSELEFYQKCFSILDVDILVDSSKSLPWVIDNNIRARKEGFSVYNILLYKDPVSFFYSFWKRGISIEHARKYEFIIYYKRFFQANLPFISLNYNQLVSDPAKTLEQLCQILSIPYFEGKEKFWEKEHHHLFGSRGTRRQVENSKSKIRKNDEYPDEFKKIIPAIESDNENDKLFQSILSNLKAHEMQEIDLLNNTVYKPIWYYPLKVKQKIRRQFPEEWKYNQ